MNKKQTKKIKPAIKKLSSTTINSSSKKKEIPIDISSLKIIGILVLLIIVFIGIIIIGYNFFLKEEVLTIDEMHQRNLAGKLDSEEGYIHNGYSFVHANGMWWTQVQREGTPFVYNIQLHYGAREVEDIPLIGDIHSFREFNETYITFDPEEESHSYTALASAELSINLASVIGIMPIAACSQNVSVTCHTAPIVTCDSGETSISMELSNTTTEVIAEGNCIRVIGNSTGLVKATDRLLLTWFGVME